MTTKDEALKQALEALEFSKSYLDDLADVHGTSKKAKPGSTSWHVDRAIAACRAALAQNTEQEPVEITDSMAFAFHRALTDSQLGADEVEEIKRGLTAAFANAAQPKRKPLTDEQIREIADSDVYQVVVFADGTKGIALDKVTVCDFARAIERAHGIGVEHDAR